MYNFFKRIIDLIVSIVALLILSPLFFLVVVMLKFTGEGEVFYLQERIGFRNKKFMIYKFATMLKNSMNMGSGSITLRNDPRVTKFGYYLRKSKINELPQIFNIIKGDLSLVGPRPLVNRTFNAYSNKIRSSIYDVKPGLTGIGSIIFRDEELIISKSSNKNPHEFYKSVIAPYKGNLELWYQLNRSTILDLKLIFITAWVILYPNSKLYEKWFNDLPKRNF